MRFLCHLLMVVMFSASSITANPDMKCAEPIDASQAKTPATGEPIDDLSLKILLDNLHNQSKWIKVHAAEYLIDANQVEVVRREFLNELRDFGSESQYRIGIWRVLARSAEDPVEQQRFTKLILDAAVDPQGTDRLHAIESLAKLAVPLSKEQLQSVREWTDAAPAAEAPFGQWGLALHFTGEEREKSVKSLLKSAASQDSLTSLRGAYALSQLTPHPPLVVEELLQLGQAVAAKPAHNDPVSAIAEAQLLSLAWQAALASQRVEGAGESFRLALRSRAKDSPAVSRIYLDQLSRSGDESDVPEILAFLAADDADLAASAANGILAVGRRTERRQHENVSW